MTTLYFRTTARRRKPRSSPKEVYSGPFWCQGAAASAWQTCTIADLQRQIRHAQKRLAEGVSLYAGILVELQHELVARMVVTARAA